MLVGILKEASRLLACSVSCELAFGLQAGSIGEERRVESDDDFWVELRV